MPEPHGDLFKTDTKSLRFEAESQIVDAANIKLHRTAEVERMSE